MKVMMQGWLATAAGAALMLGVLAGVPARAQENPQAPEAQTPNAQEQTPPGDTGQDETTQDDTKPGEAKPSETGADVAAAGPTGPYVFASPPSAQANRLYSVNVRNGEVNACQFERPEGSLVGVTRCFRRDASAQAGPQASYDILSTRYSGETGVFRVNALTGQMSVCYVRDMPKEGGGVEPAVVCTAPSSQ